MNAVSSHSDSPLEQSKVIPELESAAALSDAAPVVVVQNRGHWTRHLLPPALILATAGWIHALRPEAPPWNESDLGVAAGSDRANAKADEAPTHPASDLDSNAAAVAGTPPTETKASPPELASVPAETPPFPPKPRPDAVPLGFRPLGDIAEPNPRDAAKEGSNPDDPEGQAEAPRRELAREDRQDRIVPLPDGPPPRRFNADEMPRVLREDFHRELRRLLAKRDMPRDLMAKEIRSLRAAHRFQVSEEVRKAAGQVLADGGPKRGQSLSIPQTVKSLRRLGVPEPVVLEFIFSREAKTIGGRSGPRDVSDAWIRAARELLAAD